MLQSDWFHIFSYAPGSQKVPARVRNFNIRANLFLGEANGKHKGYQEGSYNKTVRQGP